MKGSFVRRGNPAFTLIELLVVVAIIGLLISILLPSLSRARDSARTAVCASNAHQLMLATTYYAADNRGRLPWIPGNPNSGANKPYCNGPYSQFYQLFRFYPYLKELEAFRCPSARERNSVKWNFGKNDTAAGPTAKPEDAADTSSYFVRKGDEFYSSVAYPKQYWPQFDPFEIESDEFPELYTEYFYNDFHSSVCNPLFDAKGKAIPAMNGGVLDTIAGPQYAVPMGDWGVYLAPEQQRHNGGSTLAFLDGHAEVYKKVNFLDKENPMPVNNKRDVDPFGNRPFYAWGLTRNGKDWLGE